MGTTSHVIARCISPRASGKRAVKFVVATSRIPAVVVVVRWWCGVVRCGAARELGRVIFTSSERPFLFFSYLRSVLFFQYLLSLRIVRSVLFSYRSFPFVCVFREIEFV